MLLIEALANKMLGHLDKLRIFPKHHPGRNPCYCLMSHQSEADFGGLKLCAYIYIYAFRGTRCGRGLTPHTPCRQYIYIYIYIYI